MLAWKHEEKVRYCVIKKKWKNLRIIIFLIFGKLARILLRKIYTPKKSNQMLKLAKLMSSKIGNSLKPNWKFKKVYDHDQERFEIWQNFRITESFLVFHPHPVLYTNTICFAWHYELHILYTGRQFDFDLKTVHTQNAGKWGKFIYFRKKRKKRRSKKIKNILSIF